MGLLEIFRNTPYGTPKSGTQDAETTINHRGYKEQQALLQLFAVLLSAFRFLLSGFLDGGEGFDFFPCRLEAANFFVGKFHFAIVGSNIRLGQCLKLCLRRGIFGG